MATNFDILPWGETCPASKWYVHGNWEAGYKYSLGMAAEAVRIEAAVAKSLESGARTPDLGGKLTTAQMGDAVLAAI